MKSKFLVAFAALVLLAICVLPLFQLQGFLGLYEDTTIFTPLELAGIFIVGIGSAFLAKLFAGGYDWITLLVFLIMSYALHMFPTSGPIIWVFGSAWYLTTAHLWEIRDNILPPVMNVYVVGKAMLKTIAAILVVVPSFFIIGYIAYELQIAFHVETPITLFRFSAVYLTTIGFALGLASIWQHTATQTTRFRYRGKAFVILTIVNVIAITTVVFDPHGSPRALAVIGAVAYLYFTGIALPGFFKLIGLTEQPV